MDTALSRHLVLGRAAMNRGDLGEAMTQFTLAEASPGGRRSAELHQQFGICFRLQGYHDEALQALKIAFKLARTELLRGQIQRDLGMVFLSKRRYDDAMACLVASIKILGNLCQQSPDDKAIKTEHYVTLGFIGRVKLVPNKTTARAYLRIADRALKGQPPYELNNLVWLLKAEKLSNRLRLFRRAWRLARSSGNRDRQLQVVLTTLSPPLSRLVNE